MSAAHVFGTLSRQTLGDLQPVDGMHPVELLGDQLRLVRLQRADEMPFDLAAQISQFSDLRDRFLHVVFAERALAGVEGGAHVFGGKGLRDREQRDRRGIARSVRRRLYDALPDFVEMACMARRT